MKTFLSVVSALFLSTSYAISAEFYSWTDQAGNIVITDDAGQIPRTRPEHQMRTRRLPDGGNDQLDHERPPDQEAQPPSATMGPQAEAPTRTPIHRPHHEKTAQYIDIPGDVDSAINSSGYRDARQRTVPKRQAAPFHSDGSPTRTPSAAARGDRPSTHPDGPITIPTPLPANVPPVTPPLIPNGSGAAATRR
jgi:hypothetical protein